MAEAGFVTYKQLAHDEDISKHYKNHHVLGEGMFGQTVQVSDVNDPTKLYAMKIQPKAVDVFAGVLSEEAEYEELRLFKELLILNRIVPKHPHIIVLRDILVGPTSLFMVQELCQGPDFAGFFPRTDDASGRRAFKQLAEAVHTLHEHGVVHCDIKPDNVLFKDSQCTILKLIDFGVAIYRPEWAAKRHNDFDYTKWLSADELPPPTYQPFHDVETMGCMLHCIMAGKWVPYLFQDASEEMVTTFRPRTERFSPAAMDLLRRIGPVPFGPEDQRQYLRIEEICQHPWLTGLPALAIQPAELARDLKAEFTLLENDLTVLQRLLNEWMILPLRPVASDRELVDRFEFLGWIRQDGRDTAVQQVTDVLARQRYAMKVIYGRLQGSPELVFDIGRPPLSVYMELLITLRILPRHQHIVKLREVLVNPEYVAVLRDYIKGDSLRDYIPSAAENSAREIFRQLVETVRFLHLHGVVLMDLHPYHIVFTTDLHDDCKIVNFSKAVFIPQLAVNRHENFDVNRYFTPELLQPPAHANVQVDITGLGRILHAMMARTWEPDPASCADHPPVEGAFGDSASDLLRRIGPEPFGPAQNDRTITMDEILHHPWVQKWG